MPNSFREYNDDAAMLLPLDMREWLPEVHLAYLIRDLVRSLDLAPFYQPYNPTMMVTVLIYAYATGAFPSHRTLCEFRRRHLFVAVVQLARLGTATVDGTKVRANASRHKTMSYARMREAPARLEARQNNADTASGRETGADRNPKGGSPYKHPYGEPDHEDPYRGFPAMHQCAGRGGCRPPSDRGDRGRPAGKRPGTAQCDAGPGRGNGGRGPGRGAGRCRLLQRGSPRRFRPRTPGVNDPAGCLRAPS